MDSERAVTCDMVIEAVSASFDGEPVGIETRFIEAHLAVCERCAKIVGSLPRVSPDGSDLVGAGSGGRSRRLGLLASRTAEWGLSRALIALAAVQILVFSLIDLFGGGSPRRVTSPRSPSPTDSSSRRSGSARHGPEPRSRWPYCSDSRSRSPPWSISSPAASLFAGEALHLPELVSLAAVAHLAGLFDRSDQKPTGRLGS